MLQEINLRGQTDTVPNTYDRTEHFDCDLVWLKYGGGTVVGGGKSCLNYDLL